MTTHPAPDPFAFDLSRLRLRTIPRDDGVGHVQWVYLLPASGELVHDLFRPASGFAGGIFGGGGGGGAFYQLHLPDYPFGLPEGARPIFVAFEKRVAGLSAHQRMAWAAAAMAEVTP